MGKYAASQTSPFKAPEKNATWPLTRRDLFGALFSSFVANQTQCIIGKTAVSIAVSYFKHIFIIIYSYIPLYTILYVPFTYFCNYIVFRVSKILSIFITIETSSFVFTIYSFCSN